MSRITLTKNNQPAHLQAYWANRPKTVRKKKTKKAKPVGAPGKGVKGQMHPNLKKDKDKRTKAKMERIANDKPKHSDEVLWTPEQCQLYLQEGYKCIKRDATQSESYNALSTVSDYAVKVKKLELDETRLKHLMNENITDSTETELDMEAFVKYGQEETNQPDESET